MFIKATFRKEEIYLQLFVDYFIFGSPFEVKHEISRSWVTSMTDNIKYSNSKKLEDVRPLHSMIGELNFMVGSSRPNAAFALNKIAGMTHKGTLKTYVCADTCTCMSCDDSLSKLGLQIIH